LYNKRWRTILSRLLIIRNENRERFSFNIARESLIPFLQVKKKDQLVESSDDSSNEQFQKKKGGLDFRGSNKDKDVSTHERTKNEAEKQNPQKNTDLNDKNTAETNYEKQNRYSYDERYAMRAKKQGTEDSGSLW
jgi:hypothetical protein